MGYGPLDHGDLSGPFFCSTDLSPLNRGTRQMDWLVITHCVINVLRYYSS